MAETIQELTTDIRNSVAGRGAGKTVQELVKEIRDAVARGLLKESDVRDIIAEVVDGAPEEFDTLKEIADWIEQHGQSGGSSLQYIKDYVDPQTGDFTSGVIEGNVTNGNIASGLYSHAEGVSTKALGNNSHAEGSGTTASGVSSHAEGSGTRATKDYSHVEGGGSIASGNYSHAEGYNVTASGNNSHAEGAGVAASGTNSHAEGGGSHATKDCSHAEGGGTNAKENYSHAEGNATTASGTASHAEGGGTTASGDFSHAEGGGSKATAYYSHSEGSSTQASGDYSHAEGGNTIASGDNSHAEGYNTVANHKAQHVFGAFNISDTSEKVSKDFGTYIEIVGNGTADSNRSNARTLDWSGNESLTGSLTLGKGTVDETALTAEKLKELVNSNPAQAVTAAETAAATATTKAAEAAASAAQAAEDAEEISDVKSALGATIITDTASGAIATFPDGADGVPMESVTVTMEPIQDLHGQSSPYPAGGGKNLLNPDLIEIGSYTSTGAATETGNPTYRRFAISLPAGTYTFSTTLTNAYLTRYLIDDAQSYIRYEGQSYTITLPNAGELKLTFRNTDSSAITENFTCQIEKGSTATAYAPYSNICPISGRQSVTVTRAGVNVWDEVWEVGGIDGETGQNLGNTDRIRSKNYIAVYPGTAYYFGYSDSRAASFYVCEYDVSKTFIKRTFTDKNTVFTVGSNCRYIRFFIYSAVPITTYDNNISINYPSTDHDYHPGTVASIEVQLGQTVYGGTVDVVSGVMTVDRAIVDLGTLKWKYTAASNGVFYADLPKEAKRIIGTTGSLCSMFRPTTGSDWQHLSNGDYILRDELSAVGYCAIAIRDNDYTDTVIFKTAVTGQQCVYELAQPVTVQLTAQQLTTLLGTNNVWSDADSVTVEYTADTKLYIQKVIAAALA